MSIETSDLVLEVLKVFKQVHGDKVFTLEFVAEVERPGYACVNGVCKFDSSPPAISIRSGLSDTDLVEALCHELAHVACGLEAAHSEQWEDCRNELSLRYGASRMPQC